MADGGILVDYVYSVVVVILRIRYNVLQVKYMLGQVVKLVSLLHILYRLV